MSSSPEHEKQRSVFDVHATTKHAKKRRTVKDLLYGRNVVNLKPRFRTRHPWAWVIAIVIIVGGGFFGIRHIFTKADVQDFYPSACLGNWQNSANAENHPETLGSLDTAFSGTNSAVYTSGTQIFCGGFLPQNVATSGQIVNVGLTLVWQIGNPSTSTVTTGASVVNDTSSTTDSSTDASDNTNTSDDTSASDTDSNTNNSPAPALPPPTTILTTPTTTPSDSTASTTDSTTDDTDADSTTVPTPAPPSGDGPTSFLRELLPFAYAQDDSSSPTLSSATPATSDDDSNDTSTIILGPPIMATLGSASSDTNTSSDPNATETSSSSSSLSEPVIAPPPAPDDNFLDVSYSTDGQTWVSIGEVNINNWPQLTVTLPITNWNDLQNLQIRVEGIATTQDPIPPVYLDGMLLEVHDDTTLLSPTATSTDENTSSSALISPAGTRMTIVNTAAQQTCDVQPFSQILPLGGTAAFTVNLHPSISGVSYNLMTGHLPAGISAGFSAPSGPIAATSSITFQAETSTIPGSLNIVVIYQETQSDNSVLSNFCQLNIDVK